MGVQWECKIIKTTGDLLDEDGEPLTEENKQWVHNPVDCVQQLIGIGRFAITWHMCASRFLWIKKEKHIITIKCGQESGDGRLR